MFKKIVFFCVGASLLACSSHLVVNSQNNKTAVSSEIVPNEKIDQTIKPFRDSLDKRMSEKLAVATVDFVVERPSSNLMNWMADAVFVNQTKTIRMTKPIICLLNTGGIRSSIGKGNVTLGDIYKVMPFDNTVVWVELPISVKDEIATHLSKTGGEPIANAKIIKGKLEFNNAPASETFIVITSDYLANGGDKMAFFNKKISVNATGKLLRDVLIEEAKAQGTLIETFENRINSEK